MLGIVLFLGGKKWGIFSARKIKCWLLFSALLVQYFKIMSIDAFSIMYLCYKMNPKISDIGMHLKGTGKYVTGKGHKYKNVAQNKPENNPKNLSRKYVTWATKYNFVA